MKDNNSSAGCSFSGLGGVICALLTAKIGYAVHSSVFWSVVDFFFWPIAWLKWLLCDEVNMSIIRSAFSFFLS